MRQAITVQKSRAGKYDILATPEVPFAEQVANLNALSSKGLGADVEEVFMLKLDSKTKRIKSKAKPAAKKKAAKKD